MAAPVISISSDVSVESVGSFFPRVILIGSISVEVPVALEVGAAAVASPAGIPTAPILPASSAIVTPSSKYPLAPGIDRKEVDHSSSGHSISSHSLSGHTPPDTTDADSSTPSRFVHPSLARSPRCSKAYLRWRPAPLSTMYPPTTSESSTGDSSSESSAGLSRKRCRSPAATVTLPIYAMRALVPSGADFLPPRKRFRDFISPKDSVEEDIDTDVLEDIEADATAVEVAVDRDVEAGVDAGIDMEVDVGVDVGDKVEDEVESSDRGTIEVGVDVVVEIDILDAMLMLDRIEDIEMGQRELESRSLIVGGERASLLDQVASLERSNARLRGTMFMERARADRFRRRVRFMESELRQIRRFHYYDRMRFRILETFAVRHLGFRP
ncbi:hypothetical protein Tco_0837680 [Tanacetum coccineum]